MVSPLKMIVASWRWLVGSSGSAREILHHGFLVSAVFIGLISALFNSLLNLTLPAYNIVLVTISGFIALMWYRSRFHGEFQRMAWLFCALVTFVMLPGNWLFNHGATGPTLLFYLMASAYVLAVLPANPLRRGIIIIGLMFMPWGLLAFEYARPGLVSRYASEGMRFIDMGFSYTLAFGLLSVVIAGYARRIHEERDIANAYAAQLKRLSLLDSLTGLYNHRAIHEQADAWIRRSRSACLLICDLDHFKKVNDSHGHPYGDKVLEAFSQHVRLLVQKFSGEAGRYGGEEFMILIPGNLATARQFDECLRKRCAASPLMHGAILFSTGASELHAEDTLSSWVKRSDDALYHAKRHGRGRLMVDRDLSVV